MCVVHARSTWLRCGQQVGNSVELAMEWLIAHPAAEDEEGAGGTGAGASAGQQAQGDDEALAQMVADTLSVEGERMALLQEVRVECALNN